MTTARDIMQPNVQCIGIDQSLADAATLMRDLGVGVLPICGRDSKLQGILTDRDIVVKGLASGFDPASTTAGDLAAGKPVWVRANEDVAAVLALMSDHQIRRVPVIDENKQLVGIISHRDVAMSLPSASIGGVIAAVTEGPPNN
jgi:CBS domain-containing protein